MKRNNEGFSLVEIVAAIAILGVFFSAACASLMLGLRMNEKTDAMLQSQLAVSSAVETLMAEGIDKEKDYTSEDSDYRKNAAGELVVSIEVNEQKKDDNKLPFYEVTVASIDGEIVVTTYIREKVVTES